MKILAIIPARGGSKRIKRKNVKDFCGEPIIAYSIRAALQAGCFSRVMVSTDDPEIASVAKKLGADVPFMRSAATSDDYATTADVISEVLDRLEVNGHIYDAVACIYATAPFITAERLRDAAEMLERGDAQAAFTCVEYSYPIQRSLAIGEDGRIGMKYPEYATARSQDLPKSYHDAGQFYLSTVKSFRECGSLWGPDTRPVVLSELEVQDLDTMTDWKLAEMKFKLLGHTVPKKKRGRKSKAELESRAPEPKAQAIVFARKPVTKTETFPETMKLGRYTCESYAVMDHVTSDLMLRGRNHPDIRKRMVNEGVVSREEHEAFVGSLRSRQDKAYYAVTANMGDIIGSFNMERIGPGRMERGIWIDPSQWGKNHALKILARAYDYFHRAMDVDVIETKVRVDNEASHRLEQKLGAVEVRRDEEYVYYETRLAD